MTRRFENVAAVDMEVTATGGLRVIVYPHEGAPTIVVCTPTAQTEFIEDKSHENKLW